MSHSLQIQSAHSVLILVDFQSRLMPAIHEGEAILGQSIRLAKIAQILEIPIIATEQSPNSLGSNLDVIKGFCQQTVTKEHFNACSDGLIKALPLERTQLILTGCETHVCLMQTALGLLDQQYDVSIVVDGVGSRRPLDKDTALTRLSSAGARLITVEMLAFEWLATAKHRHFKEILNLVK
jgi:nicotinamidase-related amidase